MFHAKSVPESRSKGSGIVFEMSWTQKPIRAC